MLHSSIAVEILPLFRSSPNSFNYAGRRRREKEKKERKKEEKIRATSANEEMRGLEQKDNAAESRPRECARIKCESRAGEFWVSAKKKLNKIK